MYLYERILGETKKSGIEYQPPPTGSCREPTGELRMLKGFVYNGPTNRWSAIAYASLRKEYPTEYQRLLLEKNGGG